MAILSILLYVKEALGPVASLVLLVHCYVEFLCIYSSLLKLRRNSVPRLDVHLVETDSFPSREAAKRAIKSGHVLVNGYLSKPSKSVSPYDVITVIDRTFANPMGYSKLKKLDSIISSSLVSEGDLVLDIGSSAGGFALYLLEHGATLIGIEYSKEFESSLLKIANQYESSSFLFADAFSLDPRIVCEPEKLDLLTVDVTTDPEGTLLLIQRYSILLKSGARLIATFKSKDAEIVEKYIIETIESFGYIETILHNINTNQQEFHVEAIRH
ncbi:MAG: cell division protein FtsJ [Candidatus Lokiarchaeota archaeon]|nr:cell division protein FtsJ [Candidatus Lokiarchaeota archaeon]